MDTVTVRIPRALLKRAQAATGRRDADAAVRTALELATGRYELKAAARRALDESRREERQGKVRRFKNAKDAIAHLKRNRRRSSSRGASKEISAA